MKTKIEIKSVIGTLLFEYETEDNSVKKTLEKAVSGGAYLRGANLEGANLGGANLEGANLEGAYLEGANLEGANLEGAYLEGANLRGANLRGANLRGANLRGANLGGANLGGANLRGAYLGGAYLGGANLGGAYLGGAKDADYVIAQTRILPEGDIIGYKKAREGVIVKMLIPSDAKRSHAFGRKCRAEFAKVLEITGGNTAVSLHEKSFTYRVGDTIKPTEKFDENWMEECSTGIHFFITRIEAEKYN